jgi:hypothetical protein
MLLAGIDLTGAAKFTKDKAQQVRLDNENVTRNGLC